MYKMSDMSPPLLINTPYLWLPGHLPIPYVTFGGTPACHFKSQNTPTSLPPPPAALKILLHFWGMWVQIVPGDNKHMK